MKRRDYRCMAQAHIAPIPNRYAVYNTDVLCCAASSVQSGMDVMCALFYRLFVRVRRLPYSPAAARCVSTDIAVVGRFSATNGDCKRNCEDDKRVSRERAMSRAHNRDADEPFRLIGL